MTFSTDDVFFSHGAWSSPGKTPRTLSLLGRWVSAWECMCRGVHTHLSCPISSTRPLMLHMHLTGGPDLGGEPHCAPPQTSSAGRVEGHQADHSGALKILAQILQHRLGAGLRQPSRIQYAIRGSSRQK